RRRIRSIASSSSRSSAGSGERIAGLDRGGGDASLESGGGAGLGGGGDSGSPSASRGAMRVPQPGQNRASGGSTALHSGQRDARPSPQETQKLATGAAACPHAGQRMLGSLPITLALVNRTSRGAQKPTANRGRLVDGHRFEDYSWPRRCRGQRGAATRSTSIPGGRPWP